MTDDEGQDIKNLVYTTPENVAADEVQEVDHLGFGVCLMDMRIFDVLEARAERRAKKASCRWFRFETDPKGGVIGEDVFFFNKLRDAGLKVFCDHALSWEVGHIHEIIMTNQHALKQRDGWVDRAVKARERYEQKAEEAEAA